MATVHKLKAVPAKKAVPKAAAKTARKTTAPATDKQVADAAARVKDVDLSLYAHREMVRYAREVNEDRAVSEYHDGFKPVQRRVLWAAYHGGYRAHKPVEKSARLVGDTLGKFHPHGDTACYGAVVNMTQMLYPLLDGTDGNFGDFFKPKSYAAMRYTNTRLTKFSEAVFFDAFYMPMMKTVANYDDKDREPLHMVSLLPNILFNTTFAIGVGLTARIPRFTLKSVAAMLVKVFEGAKADVKNCTATLEFTSQGGGVIAPNQRAQVRDLFTTGKGQITYNSVYHIESDAKKIIFTGFAPFSNFDARVERLLAMPGVARVSDETEPEDRVGRFAVYMKASIAARDLHAAAERVATAFSERETYFNNVTIRSVSKEDPDTADIALRSTTIPELINKWCAYRVKLEVSACAHQIKVKDAEIRKIDVMRIAVANRALIIKALDKKVDDEQLAAYLAKSLKVTVEEAKAILDLKVRQLKALEDEKLKAELKRLKELRAQYVKRRDNPAAYCAQHVKELTKEFA